MIDQTEPRRHLPPLHIDADAIAARLTTLATVGLCPRCAPAVTATLADLADVLIEVTRLFGLLVEARRESANRLAAIRAALGAAADGDSDPLGFLRDEVATSDSASFPFRGGRGCR